MIDFTSCEINKFKLMVVQTEIKSISFMKVKVIC